MLPDFSLYVNTFTTKKEKFAKNIDFYIFLCYNRGVICGKRGENMDINKKELNERIKRWDEALKSYALPSWEELPELNLYMDQVILLMNKYLSIYCKYPTDDKLITPSIINNYVKLKVIPSPIKKKYSKTHLAYLIMVCTLKQCLSISTIRNIIPLSASEKTLKEIYESFRQNAKTAFETVAKKANDLETDEEDLIVPDVLHEALLKSALEASACKVFTERIVALEFPDEKTK